MAKNFKPLQKENEYYSSNKTPKAKKKWLVKAIKHIMTKGKRK